MRTTALPSMLETLARNASVRNSNVKLYELAKVYRPKGDVLPVEKKILTLGAYGGVNFFDVKGAVETILSQLHVENVKFKAQSEIPYYHPGRCAEIFSGEKFIGTVGQIHPKVAQNYEIGECYAAQIDLENAIANREPEKTYTPIAKYPIVSRDIAVVCDNAVTVAELTDCIKKSGGALLRSVELFDVYTGSPIPDGKKSVAFALKLYSDEATLTVEQADEETKQILAGLEKELGAVIR